MKLSEYAKKLGISYQTACNHWKAGILDAYQLETGTVIVNEVKHNCTTGLCRSRRRTEKLIEALKNDKDV